MTATKVVFLVLPRVHMLDLSGALQTFQEAIEYGAKINIDYCSYQDGLVSSSEFPLGKLKRFDEISFNAGDYLFIPGSDVDFLLSYKLGAEKKLKNWVFHQHETGVNIASVCTGAFFLGKTGLLDGRKCTTHWKRIAQLKNHFPLANVVEDILFIEDEGVYTSAGVTAGVDMALAIVEKISSDMIAHKVARELVVYLRRTGTDAQQSAFMKYRNHIHSGIHKAQDFIQENIKIKVSLDLLAEKACMSTRNLTRAFKKETGVTVNEYTNLIRRELLKALTKNPDIKRKQLAQHLGLKSERQVLRLLYS